MRLGGGIERPFDSPEAWIALVKELGYGAVLAPVAHDAPEDVKAAYVACAKAHDVVIGEVGAWKNPLSPNAAERAAAMDYAKAQLALADELGARCCVNISGSRGALWDGCYEDNYATDTYALIVDSVREIIDAVKPTRTFYTLEPMPWMHPDSPEDYLQMIADIERPAFGVHLDYTNMIGSVGIYLHAMDFVKHCFALLGPHIKSVHAKDIRIGAGLPCQISEVMPGEGVIDCAEVLRLSHALDPDMTVFIEHLPSFEAYHKASGYMQKIAKQAHVPLYGPRN